MTRLAACLLSLSLLIPPPAALAQLRTGMAAEPSANAGNTFVRPVLPNIGSLSGMPLFLTPRMPLGAGLSSLGGIASPSRFSQGSYSAASAQLERASIQAAAALTPAQASVLQAAAVLLPETVIQQAAPKISSANTASAQAAGKAPLLQSVRRLDAAMAAAAAPRQGLDAGNVSAAYFDGLSAQAKSAIGSFAGTFLPNAGIAARAKPQADEAAADSPDQPESSADEVPAEQETVTSEISAPRPETMDLIFGWASKKMLLRSQHYATVRLLDTRGREWYWGRFDMNVPVRILTGWRTLFFSRIQRATTKRIRDITPEDLKGVYSSQILKPREEESAEQLTERLLQKLIEDLTAKNRFPKRGRAKVVTLDSPVRVLHFMPYSQARKLPENADEPLLEVRPRKPVSVPKSLAPMSKFLPKLVFLDLRLFKNPVSYDLLEDMSKLLMVGVHFVLLSDRPQTGQGSVEELLSTGLSARQRNSLVRFNLFSLSDSGNSLYEYQDSFSNPLPSRRFSPLDIETVEHAARSLGMRTTAARSNGIELTLPKGSKNQPLAETLTGLLDLYGLKNSEYSLTSAEAAGRTTLTLRPASLASAIGTTIASLREHKDLYINPNDTLVISKDPAVLAATKGTIHAVKHAPNLSGEDLTEMSFAAMLGDFRENKPGDLATSASKITEFLHPWGEKSDGGNDDTIFTMGGHVIHAALANWAPWVYQNTGRFPSVEEVLAKAQEIWRRKDYERVRNLLWPGEAMAGYVENYEAHLREMYAGVVALLKEYPIVLGTELPNNAVIQRYKKSDPTHRDIFRFKYDLVLARQVPGGLEILPVDLKTGDPQTLQPLGKDDQLLLYDMLARTTWPTIHLPYGVTGKIKKVLRIETPVFVYAPGPYQPLVTEWGEKERGRIPFEKHIFNVANRMRKAKAAKAAAAAPAKPGKPVETITVTSEQGFKTLKLPRSVSGLKIQERYAQMILRGEKTIEYRRRPAKMTPFFAIIETYPDKNPRPPAKVVGFARIEKVVKLDNGQFEWHLSHVTPVEPYDAPARRGAIIWIKDVPVRGAKELKAR